MYFYGSKATPDFAKTTAASIQNQWNGANGTVSIGGEDYKVKFDVKGLSVSDNDLPVVFTISTNNSLEKNYIRIEGETDHFTGASYSDKAGSNSGYWSLDQNKESKSTTSAHEYGHGLGEEHPRDGGKNGRSPNIMATQASRRADGSGVDVTQRKVTQDNIDQIFTPKVLQSLQQNKTTGLGTLTNEYHSDSQ